MTELITITSGNLTARINPLGAELWSLADADGREYMTGADPAFWTGHAPLLFPIVGALNQGRYRLGQVAYELPRHGFARQSMFACVEAGAAAATFRLTDSEETRRVYPFAFALDMAFAIEGWTLHMTATVANRGDEAMPFSLGFHPAFAWPLPGGAAKDEHRVTLARTSRSRSAGSIRRRDWCCPIRNRRRSKDGHWRPTLRCSRPMP